jgi:hypothetical protein
MTSQRRDGAVWLVVFLVVVFHVSVTAAVARWDKAPHLIEKRRMRGGDKFLG